MNNKELLEEIGKLLDNKRATRFEKVKGTIEKIMIPICLLILSGITFFAGNEIAKSQLQLSHSQADQARTLAENELQLKYLDIFWNDINSRDTTKQFMAIELLDLMHPDLSSKLISIVKSQERLTQNEKKLILQTENYNKWKGIWMIRWEKGTKYNIRLKLYITKGKLNGEYEYYQRDKLILGKIENIKLTNNSMKADWVEHKRNGEVNLDGSLEFYLISNERFAGTFTRKENYPPCKICNWDGIRQR